MRPLTINSKIYKPLIWVVIIALTATVLIVYRPMRLDDLVSNTFDDIAKINVKDYMGWVDKDYEVVDKKQIDCVSLFLKELIVRRQPRAFAPDQFTMRSGEDYIVELYQGNGSVDTLTLNSGYIRINDVLYPVSAPKTFALLRAMLVTE